MKMKRIVKEIVVEIKLIIRLCATHFIIIIVIMVAGNGYERSSCGTLKGFVVVYVCTYVG